MYSVGKVNTTGKFYQQQEATMKQRKGSLTSFSFRK